MKDLYIAAHEELIEEMMETTGCDWDTAYNATGDAAYLRMSDRMAYLADRLRDQEKEGRF